MTTPTRRRFPWNQPLAGRRAARRRRELITEIRATLARARTDAATLRATLVGSEVEDLVQPLTLDDLVAANPAIGHTTTVEAIVDAAHLLGRPLMPWQQKVLEQLVPHGAADA